MKTIEITQENIKDIPQIIEQYNVLKLTFNGDGGCWRHIFNRIKHERYKYRYEFLNAEGKRVCQPVTKIIDSFEVTTKIESIFKESFKGRFKDVEFIGIDETFFQQNI